MDGHLVERFANSYRVDPVKGCWLWVKGKTGPGYGAIGIGGKVKLAHRVSWELHNGAIPRGEGYHGTCVLHRCDVRCCVNPDHLFLGTNADNQRDLDAKGRRRPGRVVGERSWKTRLTEADVRMLRAKARHTSYRQVAKEYGISPGSVSMIVSRQRWAHVS